MDEKEKEEFQANVSLMAQQTVQALVRSGLGPVDSAYVLGVAAQTIVTLMISLMSVTREDAANEVRVAMLGGFEKSEVHVIAL